MFKEHPKDTMDHLVETHEETSPDVNQIMDSIKNELAVATKMELINVRV
jgi:hypothetical protein